MLIGLPVLYVASFGRAVWIAGRENLSATAVERFYRPILLQLVHGSAWLNEWLWWYGKIGMPPRYSVQLRVMSLDGGTHYVTFLKR